MVECSMCHQEMIYLVLSATWWIRYRMGRCKILNMMTNEPSNPLPCWMWCSLQQRSSQSSWLLQISWNAFFQCLKRSISRQQNQWVVAWTKLLMFAQQSIDCSLIKWTISMNSRWITINCLFDLNSLCVITMLWSIVNCPELDTRSINQQLKRP